MESNNNREKQTEEKPVNYKPEEPVSSNIEQEVSGNSASENELEKLKKQLAEEKDRCLRLNAEFENQRKRSQKEKEEFVKYANEKLIIEFIDILESLERGLENTKGSNNKDKLIHGLELIYKQLKNVLEKNGLAPIKALGEKFDPYKHEAMMQTPSDDNEEGTILEEFARGYMLNNKVIRYSKVRVSKNKDKDNENEVS
ncbi:MAG: nucleotide exchange factor GrpE [Candidatus Methanoperedens sp.]|nr:nucleotide exchange factor GrpE [Candidatus Methanoperedens sp.]